MAKTSASGTPRAPKPKRIKLTKGQSSAIVHGLLGSTGRGHELSVPGSLSHARTAKSAPAPGVTVLQSNLGTVTESDFRSALSKQFLGVAPPLLSDAGRSARPSAEEDAESVVTSEAPELASEVDDDLEASSAHAEEDADTPLEKQKRKLETAHPILAWLEKDDVFLREMIRRKGQGDAFDLDTCPDCGSAGRPEYSCGECEAADMCRDCIVKWHRYQPLHPIFRHSAGRPERLDPADLGLCIQLGHRPGEACRWRESSHVDNFTILHTSGLCRIRVDFCNCDLGKDTPRYVQLLRRGLWPSTIENPQSATSLQALDDFTRLSNLGRLTAYDYHRAASSKTDGAGLRELPDFRQQFMTSIHEYRHIMLFMRAGRGHEPGGIKGTPSGLCAVRCPACPDKDMNLEKGWASRAQQWLNRATYSLDANFRLSNRLSKSSNKTDPYLNHGCAYMPPAEDYRAHLVQMDEEEIEQPSDCSRFGAINQANMKAGRGLRTTGMAACTCKHEFWQPNGITTLRKGERYVSVDYAFCGAMKHSRAPTVLVTYDIACQWHKKLHERLEKIPAQREIYAGAMAMLDLILKDKALFCVPKFHLYAHKLLCQINYAIGWTIGTGALDGEGCERCWSGTNGAASSLREMGPGTMHDTMDDICGSWNWVKVCGMGISLAERMWRAVMEGRTQSAIFTEFTDAIKSEEPEAVEIWTKKVENWEEKPKKSKNPYQPVKKSATIKQIQLETVLAQGHATTTLASQAGIADAAGASGASSSLHAALDKDAANTVKSKVAKSGAKGKRAGKKDAASKRAGKKDAAKNGKGKKNDATPSPSMEGASEDVEGVSTPAQPAQEDVETVNPTVGDAGVAESSPPIVTAGADVGAGAANDVGGNATRINNKRKAPRTDGDDYVLPAAVDVKEYEDDGDDGHGMDGPGSDTVTAVDVDEAVAQAKFLLRALQIENDQYRLDKKQDENGDTLSQTTTRTKALNALVREIERFRDEQEQLMPRLHATLTTEERNPERATALAMKLWLPSDLHATDDCSPGSLRALEIRVRWAAMSDELENLMHQLRLRGCLNRFKILNISGQRANTRARTAQDAVDANVKAAANAYRRHRSAYFNLVGPGDWQKTMRTLADSDCRGLGDRLIEQIEGMSVKQAREFVALRKGSSSSGETKYKLPWIWYRKGNPEDGDGLKITDELMLEWLKNRARARNWVEEVWLVDEEMGRVLRFNESVARIWEARCYSTILDGVTPESSEPDGAAEASSRSTGAVEATGALARAGALDQRDGRFALWATKLRLSLAADARGAWDADEAWANGVRAYALQQAWIRRRQASLWEQQFGKAREEGRAFMKDHRLDGICTAALVAIPGDEERAELKRMKRKTRQGWHSLLASD
ncbi:unnamed protein product [Peniophora sp. CBMAI 1063]|nr:unnamed protein product [Peniophora sp. CBMAI 1063]